MAKFLSSIFSFDTLRLATVPREWGLSVALVLALLVAGEGVARVLLAPIGNRVWTYWAKDAADKFESYRALALAGHAPDVVIIGDSVGVRNIDTDAFARAAGVAAINLAWPGNFPLAMRVNTLPLLRDAPSPDYVIVAQSPWSYVETESAARNESVTLSSILAKRVAGHWVTADHVYMSRLYAARIWLFEHWLRGRPIVSRPPLLGFTPHIRPRGNTATAEAALPQRFEGEPEFDDARRATLIELLDVARMKGFRLIVLVSPLSHGMRPPAVERHVEWLQSLAGDHGDVFRLWDLSKYKGLADEDFKDFLHLWSVGAERYGALLGDLFARCHAQDTDCELDGIQTDDVSRP